MAPMTPSSRNLVLSQVEPSAVPRIADRIQCIRLRRGSVLQEVGTSVQWVWFPEDALISIASENASGESVTGGMIGWNGAYGAFEACGSRTSFTRALVQISGAAHRIRADHYRELFDQSSALRSAIHRHIEALLVEARQLIACTALHSVESRLCRVLLDASERSHGGTSLSLTQEALAQMLGVQRTTIAVTASSLQKGGLIRTGRGSVELLDLRKLNATACACRATIGYAAEEIYSSRRKVCEG
jgi:CRP-like cAMP-binding protein